MPESGNGPCSPLCQALRSHEVTQGPPLGVTSALHHGPSELLPAVALLRSISHQNSQFCHRGQSRGPGGRPALWSSSATCSQSQGVYGREEGGRRLSPGAHWGD